jgi:hypothetical protein
MKQILQIRQDKQARKGKDKQARKERKEEKWRERDEKQERKQVQRERQNRWEQLPQELLIQQLIQRMHPQLIQQMEPLEQELDMMEAHSLLSSTSGLLLIIGLSLARRMAVCELGLEPCHEGEIRLVSDSYTRLSIGRQFWLIN